MPAAPRLFDPARDSARLLGWVGISVLMVIAPLAGVLSRRSLFVLLPIGAGLLFAAFFIAVSSAGLRAFGEAMRQPTGLASGFLAVWAGLSLIWTPFPAEIAPRLITSLTTIVLATLIISHLPERRSTRALYLLPGGLAVTALATLGMVLFGPATFRGGSEFDPSLLERSILTLVVLVWPALGALSAFGRWRLAMALAALVAATIAISGASIGMAVFAIGAVTFAAVVDDAPRVSRRVALFFAGLLLLAPALPFVLAPLAAAVAPVGKKHRRGDGRLARHRIERRPPTDHRTWPRHRLARRRYMAAIAHAPHHPVRDLVRAGDARSVFPGRRLRIWLSRSRSNASVPAAPSLLAGMVVTVAIAIFGVATAQEWFVTLASLQAVAFGLLCRCSVGNARPPAAHGEPFPDVAEVPDSIGLGPAAATPPNI